MVEVCFAALERLKGRIFSEAFVPYKFHPKNSSFEPNLKNVKSFIRKIDIDHQWTDDQSNERIVSNETYSLDLSEDGRLSVKIVSTQDGLHVINTLSQLFYAHSECRNEVYTPYAPIFIKNSSIYEHQKILLDICRNQISPKDIMRTIEGLALNKLNRLHLHTTDSQF